MSLRDEFNIQPIMVALMHVTTSLLIASACRSAVHSVGVAGHAKSTVQGSTWNITRMENHISSLRTGLSHARKELKSPVISKSDCMGIVVVFTAMLLGCGDVPLISPNREGFPPWEAFPEGNGIQYVEKFTQDSGVDPLYLAKFCYDDEASLDRVIEAFSLVPHAGESEVLSFASEMPNSPDWFPLPNSNQIYVFPSDNSDYVANLWVDTETKSAVLERAWW